MAQEWDRDTPWRQGHLLPLDTFGKILPERQAEGYCTAIIISHDCDLASSVDDEPVIELLLCKFADEHDGNYTFSKNSRHLQIPLHNTNAKIVLDIQIGSRLQIDKLTLQNELPDKVHVLTREELRTFQLWLSGRYARSAFSNEFNDIFKLKKFKWKKWTKVIEPLGATLEAIYFDVDDSDGTIRTSGDPPFELVIFLRYTLNYDEQGLEKITAAANEINDIFKATFYDQANQCWNGVELKFCAPVSSDALTVAEHQKLRIWDSAYISLRASPQQPVAKR